MTTTRRKLTQGGHNCPGGRGVSHIDMVFVYVPVFWGAFSRNLYSDRGVFIRDKGRTVASLTVPWARIPFPHSFLKFWSIILKFPQFVLIFFLILALRLGGSPTRKGPGYATGQRSPNSKIGCIFYANYCKSTKFGQNWMLSIENGILMGG